MDSLLTILEYGEYGLEFGWINKDTWGKVIPERNIIIINLPLFITTTYVHEWLHLGYPNATEEEILEKEKRYIKRMRVSTILSLSTKLMDMGFSMVLEEVRDENRSEPVHSDIYDLPGG